MSKFVSKENLSYFWQKIKTLLSGKADKNEIPTNTNQLTNGAGFVTSSGSVANATKLNNQDASYYLNYNNFTNKPTLVTVQVYSSEAEALAASQADPNKICLY